MSHPLLEVLGNSHFEAYIGGPVAGVIVAAIFSGFGNPPNNGSGGQTPGNTYIQIVNRYEGKSQASQINTHTSKNGDASPMIGAGLIFLLFGFLFAVYLPQISLSLYFAITSVATFSITTCLISLLSGRFNTFAWWQYTIFPTLISFGCFYVAMIAEKAVNIEVVNFAQLLLGAGHLTLANLINSTFIFYKNLNNDYVQWLGYQMAAFIFVSFSAIEVFLQCLHYVALSNARTGNAPRWSKLALRTGRFSGIGTVMTSIVFLTLAALFASGEAYRFLHG